MSISILRKIVTQYWLSLTILLAVLFLIIQPLLHDGFFPTFDDVQVVRVDEMTKELRSGQFPVRFVNDLGNGGGYNLFSFYPPLVYYIGAAIHLIGIPLVKVVKLTFILGYLISGTGMYLLLKYFFSKRLAVIGAALFLTSPFLNYEVFIRGALAEFFGMAIFPLTLWLLIKLIEEKQIRYFLLFGFSFAALILAHTFVGLFAALFFMITIFILSENKKAVTGSLLGILLGISLTVWFWLPVFFQQGLTQYSQSFFATQSFSTNFLSPLAVFGIKPPSWDFLPPLLGISLFLGAILGIGLGVYKKLYRKSRFFSLSVVGFVFCVFIISSSSKFIWELSQQLRYMQFPWRFLVFLTVFAIILSVFFLSIIKNRLVQMIFALVLFSVAIVFYSSYLNPKTYNFISNYYAEDSCGTTTWAQEYLPRQVEKCLPRSKSREFIYPKITPSKGVRVGVSETEHGRNITLTTSGEKGTVTLRKYYSPGWKGLLDNRHKLDIYASKPYGLVSINVPKGRHEVEIALDKTSVEVLSEYMTIGGVFLSLVLFILTRNSIMKKK